jgi:hypothetical protein
MIIMPSRRRASLIVRVLAFLTLSGFVSTSFASDLNQSQLSAPPGDGWQLLSTAPAASSTSIAMISPEQKNPEHSGLPPMIATAPVPHNATPTATTAAAAQGSSAVTSVVLPGVTGVGPGGVLTFAITPQDINLRDALDRWLQQQGWQLAWKIDDDLPIEFNATFSGDFDTVLTQVMRATNHMRTPTRICVHTNNVIRVVARAANCLD